MAAEDTPAGVPSAFAAGELQPGWPSKATCPSAMACWAASVTFDGFAPDLAGLSSLVASSDGWSVESWVESEGFSTGMVLASPAGLVSASSDLPERSAASPRLDFSERLDSGELAFWGLFAAA